MDHNLLFQERKGDVSMPYGVPKEQTKNLILKPSIFNNAKNHISQMKEKKSLQILRDMKNRATFQGSNAKTA